MIAAALPYSVLVTIIFEVGILSILSPQMIPADFFPKIKLALHLYYGPYYRLEPTLQLETNND